MASTTQSQEFAGGAGIYTFTPAANVSTVLVTMIAGGGGGAGLRGDTNAAGRGGGGSGEYCLRQPVEVTPGVGVTVVIGAGGAGGIGNNPGNPGCDGSPGTASSFGNYIVCNPGLGAPATTSTILGGSGGGVGGTIAIGGTTNQPAPRYEYMWYTGGGAGARTTGSTAFLPSPAINFPGLAPVTGLRPSGDGAPSPWGVGGRGVPVSANGGNAAGTSYGAGGAGAGGTGTATPVFNGGNGADGYCLVEWVA